MKYFIIIIFFLAALSSIGQKTICFHPNSKDEIKDSLISSFQGNLIPISETMPPTVLAILNKKSNIRFVDKVSKQEYLFLDSIPNPIGWLIIDKTKNRVNYIDQERVFTFNISDSLLVFYKSKKCGFDIIMRSNDVCGYSEPCYNTSNGHFSFKTNKLLNRNIWRFIDTEKGILKKLKINKAESTRTDVKIIKL